MSTGEEDVYMRGGCLQERRMSTSSLLKIPDFDVQARFHCVSL
jgi:hypothetical protein